MSTPSDKISSARSGKGGVQMIRKNGGGYGRERRTAKRHNRKVTGGKGNDNADRVKEEQLEEQEENITRIICKLGYVQIAFSTLLVFIFISRMDNSQSWEELRVDKSLRKLGRPHVRSMKTT